MAIVRSLKYPDGPVPKHSSYTDLRVQTEIVGDEKLVHLYSTGSDDKDDVQHVSQRFVMNEVHAKELYKYLKSVLDIK